MTVLAAILPIVSRSSTLALDLYNLNPTSPDARKGWINIAKAVSSFAVAVKQTGTIIKEDDRLPSHEAIEALEDVINQAQTILSEVESTLPLPDSYDDESAIIERLQYLTAHFDALRATLSVMLQTLHTSQSIMWARTRQTVSPQKAATAVANEKSQLETLIIEQQTSILSASRFYGLCRSRSDARLLMEQDSSQSLVPVIADGGPQPVRLLRYQDKFIASLEMSDSADEAWLPAICGIAKSQVEHLLERWTCLRQFEDNLREAERRRQARRRESLQPTVESDSEDETHLGGCGVKTVAPTPRLPNGIQPLFTETTSLPIPVSQPKFGPTAPLSPASSYGMSPRFSGNSLPIPGSQPGSVPVSPRTSISNLPVEAAAAVEAQEEDEDVQLEIPWALRTRKHFWKYVDSRVVDSNCDLSPSVAFSERNCWTEILALWVCKEAIKEAGYQCTQVQKERRDGRRTKLETCFCIEQPLTFEQVHLLVERTVEIFRRKQPPSPPPRSPHFQNDPLSVHSKGTPQDRDRTPVAKQYPPLERSTTSFPFPPPPPPLDRSVSLPNSVPKYPPQPRIATGHLSIPQPYTYQEPYSPQPVPHSPQATAYFPQVYPLPNPYPHMMPIQHQAPNAAYPVPLSPLRQSIRFDANGNANPPQAYSSDLSTSGTSDSDSVVRSRKQRSRSRDRRSSPRNKKKSHGHNSGTLGALMGVGGLTALLDGLSGL